MAFVKGMKRPEGAGKPKGYSARRKKAKDDIRAVLERREVNLIDEVLDNLPDLRPVDRVDILMRLVEYTTPKLRAVEVVGMPQASVQVNVANIQPPERSQFRQLLENADTLAAVRLLDSQLDNKKSSLDENLVANGNGSHLGEVDAVDKPTNQKNSIETVDLPSTDPEKKL